MKVILLTDVKNLGKKGSVVNVADGMAMNSLLPQKKAIIATADNMQKLSADVHNKENHAAAQTAAAMKFLEKIPSELVIAQKVNEKGNLFKTIDAVAIAKELAAVVGHTGSIPCKVVPSEPAIKSLGSYPCTLVVHDGVTKKDITRTLSVVIQKA